MGTVFPAFVRALPSYNRDVPFIEHNTICAAGSFARSHHEHRRGAAYGLSRGLSRRSTHGRPSTRTIRGSRSRTGDWQNRRVAAFNGWTTALIAAASAPFSFTSPVALALTVGLAVIAFNEFRGRKPCSISNRPAQHYLVGIKSRSWQ